MKLNAIFSDNMILQANKPIYVFGSSRGKATVEISDKKATTVSNSDNWLVELPAFNYGGSYEMLVNLDGDIKEFKDIYLAMFIHCRDNQIINLNYGGLIPQKNIIKITIHYGCLLLTGWKTKENIS